MPGAEYCYSRRGFAADTHGLNHDEHQGPERTRSSLPATEHDVAAFDLKQHAWTLSSDSRVPLLKHEHSTLCPMMPAYRR